MECFETRYLSFIYSEWFGWWVGLFLGSVRLVSFFVFGISMGRWFASIRLFGIGLIRMLNLEINLKINDSF